MATENSVVKLHPCNGLTTKSSVVNYIKLLNHIEESTLPTHLKRWIAKAKAAKPTLKYGT